MDVRIFSCSMCGERHRKYLPGSTSITTCHKCGNLIEFTSNPHLRNRANDNNNGNIRRRNNFIGFNDNDDVEASNNNNINSNYLDDDFYDFNRYSGHDDYLPSRRDIERDGDDLSELNDNLLSDEFDRFYSGNILNNNPQSRVFHQTNTRYNFSNVNLNQGSNRPFQRFNQRSLSTNQASNNNRNNNSNNRSNNRNNNSNSNSNNNQNSGMFSIQIPNDSYDRYSALHHRSNFGYRGEDNVLHDFDDLLDLSIQNEMEYDLELMSRANPNPLSRSIGLVGSLIIKPEKPKIKLEKTKMTKDLYTKNDGNKNELPVCCICLAPMKLNQEVTLLKCQHLFHFSCLDKWVQNKEACPFCRGKIEFAKIKKKNNDKKEDFKIVINGNTININNLVKPIIGDRKTSIIRSNNSILNSNNKKNNKSKKK